MGEYATAMVLPCVFMAIDIAMVGPWAFMALPPAMALLWHCHYTALAALLKTMAVAMASGYAYKSSFPYQILLLNARYMICEGLPWHCHGPAITLP